MGLREQIQERIKSCHEKGILKKVERIAQELGEHTRPSYRDSGETFYEDSWVFKKGRIIVECFRGYFGHESSQVSWNSKVVFERSLNGDISSYVPGKEWEVELDRLYAPFAKKDKRINEASQKALRKRFGL